MLRVEMADARPGMELAMPINHPTSPETVLLRAGFKLDPKTIGRLQELRAREIWIQYPGMEFVAEQISPSIIEAGQRLSGAVAKSLGEALADARADLDYALFRRAIADLVDRLVDSPKAATMIVDLASERVPLARSAGHGCFLALVLGMKLETYLLLSRQRLGMVAKDVSNLGMGALMRDVGITSLDEEERWRWRLADDDADPTWRKHVQLGYEMVRGAIEPSAAAAVLHHHQRFDGSGFPHKLNLHGEEHPLSGQEIHIFARIIAVADAFDRLRHPAPEGPDEGEPPPVPTVRVLRRMLRSEMASGFDPIVLKGLVHAAPAFPPGGLVTLSDGRLATVIAWDPLHPCRPIVAILDRRALEPGSYEEPGERIDLRTRTDISVAESEGQNVSEDLFDSHSESEFDIQKAQSDMIYQAA